jgi:hypothetical protein
MSEGQRVLWKFKAKMKPTVPLGQLPYQGATSYFWSILGDKKSNGFYILFTISFSLLVKHTLPTKITSF